MFRIQHHKYFIWLVQEKIGENIMFFKRSFTKFEVFQ